MKGSVFWLGAGGAALSAAGAYGTGFKLWPLSIGALMLMSGLALAVVALIIAIIAAFRLRGRGGIGGRGLIGVAAAVGLIGTVGYWLYLGRGAPMIHDVTTNSAAPPAFVTLPTRRETPAMQASWRQLHDSAYSDIRPLIIAKPPAEIMATAKRLAEERGWTIASATADRLEATETASPFKFEDDVVIVATPVPEGTRIDMRSVSRVGVGDLGVNARRVRDFLSDLKAAT